MIVSFISSIGLMSWENYKTWIIKFNTFPWKPKLTQNVFPAYELMFCNFMKVIKHILIDSPGSEFLFCSLGIFKGTNKALWFNKRSCSKREREKEEKQSAIIQSFNCYSSKWGLIIFNRENVTIDRFKINLLKLTDYPILYHKRMHPHPLQAFLQETWGCTCFSRMLSI